MPDTTVTTDVASITPDELENVENDMLPTVKRLRNAAIDLCDWVNRVEYLLTVRQCLDWDDEVRRGLERAFHGLLDEMDRPLGDSGSALADLTWQRDVVAGALTSRLR